jgi:hypothetical protein
MQLIVEGAAMPIWGVMKNFLFALIVVLGFQTFAVAQPLVSNSAWGDQNARPPMFFGTSLQVYNVTRSGTWTQPAQSFTGLFIDMSPTAACPGRTPEIEGTTTLVRAGLYRITFHLSAHSSPGFMTQTAQCDKANPWVVTGFVRGSVMNLLKTSLHHKPAEPEKFTLTLVWQRT